MGKGSLETYSAEELEAELARRRASSSPLLNLCTAEDEIDQEADQFKERSLTARVQALPLETSAPKPCPKCGELVRVRTKARERRLRTRSGTLSLQRNYHYCNQCRGGFYPRDRELGLPAEGDVSFGLEAKILDFGINDTFTHAAERWSVHYLKPISENLVRRVVDRVGKRRDDSDECYLQHVLQPPPAEPTQLLMVQVDGSMIPLRGAEPWKEVKLAALVRAECHLKGSRHRRGAISEARYVGVLGDVDALSVRLDKALRVEKVRRVKKVLWLGDGAPWIWRMADALCPQAIPILDWYHALEHALQCGQALLEGTSLLDDWERTCRHLLSQGEVEQVLEQLMECIELADNHEAKAINDLVRYYRNNIERMRYDKYRAAGYPIGSGIIESAHGHVIQQRMKRTGQRWSCHRARRMVGLRTAYRSCSSTSGFSRGIRIAAETTRVASIASTENRQFRQAKKAA